MGLIIGSTCSQPTITPVGKCVPIRLLKIKKLLAIKGSLLAADAANLFPKGLGGSAESDDIVTVLNKLIVGGEPTVAGTLVASPEIGGFTMTAAAVTTLSDVNACKPVNLVTGQEATFKSTQAETAAVATFVTPNPGGEIGNYLEWDWWHQMSDTTGCFSGNFFAVDCDLVLYYFLIKNFNCSPAEGAAAFADLTLTANMTTDGTTGAVTWEGKLSNTTGFIMQPVISLTGTGVTPNALLI
jgi:hypothetical protein